MNNSKNAFVVLQIDKNEYISASIVLAYSLRRVFVREDLIIMVNNKISLKCLDILKKTYDRVIEIDKISNKMSINKLLGLQFEEYNKVALIDSDSIIFKNIDFIFCNKTPSIIKNSTGLIVIEPNKDKLNSIKKNLLKKNYSLIELLKQNYKKIYEIDFKILESNNYNKKSYGIQFNKNKPFILESDISLEERIKWKHFNMWYYFFRNTLNDNSEISSNSCIKHVIELSKNYLSNMIEFVLENNDILKVRNKEIIKEVYKLKSNEGLENYHTGVSLNYKSKELIYDNNDYIFKDFISYYNKIRNTKLIKYKNIEDFLKNEKEEDIEQFLNMYIKYTQNIFIILQTKEKKNNNDSVYDKDNNIANINLIYKKYYTLKGSVLKNILFDIDSRYTYNIRLENMKDIKDDKEYILILRICENIVNTDVIFNEYSEDVLIVNDTSSKVTISSILLNKNTLEKYIKKDIYFLSDKINTKARLLKETIKKWIYNNYSVEEIDRLFIKFDKKITINEFFKNKIICEDIPEIFTIKKHSSKEFYKLLLNIEYYEIDGIKYI